MNFGCSSYDQICIKGGPANPEEAFEILNRKFDEADVDELWTPSGLLLRRESAYLTDTYITVETVQNGQFTPIMRFSHVRNWFVFSDYQVAHCYFSHLTGETACFYTQIHWDMCSSNNKNYETLLDISLADYANLFNIKDVRTGYVSACGGSSLIDTARTRIISSKKPL